MINHNIKENPIISVLRDIPKTKILKVVDSLIKGGVYNIEIAFGSNEDKITGEMIKIVKQEFGDHIIVGAGTVLQKNQVDISAENGAQFVFSPNFNKDIVHFSLKSNITPIPGCYTPSEIFEAYQLGIKTIKLFPATSLGPQFIKNTQAPLPFVNFIPTGGINKNNIKNYFTAGAFAVGVGGSLVNSEIVNQNKFKQITSRAKELINTIETL